MTYPDFYDADKVGTQYTPDTYAAIDAGSNAGIAPADEDTEKNVLLLIDAQVDFVHEDGALSVPGAVDDTRRIIEWLFDNSGRISKIIASLDSHIPNQIFSPSWWVDANGNHPDPFTVITSEQVQAGDWKPLYQIDWSQEYVERLEENAKKQLMIWPYHTLIGTPGHTITPALYEAIAYHSAARQVAPLFITKGTVPKTEHYSIFEPEVKPDNLDGGGVDHDLFESLKQYDKIYVAGQAKSHCVLESVASMMRHYDRDTIEKIYLLQDAMSSVANPDIDFDAMADETYAQFAENGLNLTTTAEA